MWIGGQVDMNTDISWKTLKILTEQEGTGEGRCGGQRKDDETTPHKSPSYAWSMKMRAKPIGPSA
jgi:hypothetical protein